MSTPATGNSGGTSGTQASNGGKTPTIKTANLAINGSSDDDENQDDSAITKAAKGDLAGIVSPTTVTPESAEVAALKQMLMSTVPGFPPPGQGQPQATTPTMPMMGMPSTQASTGGKTKKTSSDDPKKPEKEPEVNNDDGDSEDSEDDNVDGKDKDQKAEGAKK